MLDISDGYYHIINVEFKNYLSLTSWENGTPLTADAPIRPLPDTVKWRLERLPNNKYCIWNAAYAQSVVFVDPNAESTSSIKARSQRTPFQWAITETKEKEHYLIYLTSDTSLCWTLRDGELYTNVELRSNASNWRRSWWRFEPAPAPTHPPQLPESPGANQVANATGVIAVKNRANYYMRVTGSNGLAFNSTIRDDYALFAVRKLGGLIALISLKNGQHVNMYYINDVMCKGPGGGLSLSVEHREHGEICFGISGYQGQNGQKHFLSSETGNAAYHGSLAVSTVENDSCRLWIENITYPGAMRGVIAIRNQYGYYMKVGSNESLLFDTPVYDDDARFILQIRGQRICIIGNNGRHLALHKANDDVYVKCSGGGAGIDFGVEMRAGAHIALKVPGQGSGGNETHFLTCRESDTGGYGSLGISSVQDQDTAFTFVNL